MTVPEKIAQNSFVVLQVGERRFAMEADIVAELAPPVRLHTFPHTSPLILGVIVRRGRIIPVYDADSVLTGQPISAHAFYLIARRRFGKASELGAIPVNGECELATGNVQLPAAEQPEYVSGTLAIGEEALDILNLEALVTAQTARIKGTNQAETRP
jgi:chemotaxis signal transduction protein